MKNIGVAFSGGGFRAAAFSLGTLSYLYVLGEDGEILRNVKFIGSTSGGTITNMAYSAFLAEKAFPAIYADLLVFMDGQTLMSKVFENLNDAEKWKKRPDKSRNLINAFSIAYDDLLFKGKTFGTYEDKLPETHLEEICVNSTELSNGLSFRYQSQNANIFRGLVGNGYISFTDGSGKEARGLLLADILATSSCFPGGFEPFIFPKDFSYDGLTKSELADAIKFADNPFTTPDKPDDLLYDAGLLGDKNTFGMLDGGIADNQAIDCLLMANERRTRNGKPGFDLLLVSDVTSYFIDGYSLPTEGGGLLSRLSIDSITKLLLYSGLCFPVVVALSLFIGWHHIMYVLFLPTLVALAIYLYGKFKLLGVKLSASKNKSTWNLMVFQYGAYFLKLNLSVLIQMLTARAKSVALMATDIFMKKIRSMYYKQIYSDVKLRTLVVSNAIYDLSKSKQEMKLDEKETAKKELGYNEFLQTETEDAGTLPPPSDAIIDLAEKARLMATTLWFDRFQSLDDAKAVIVATGQFTTCYNLLKYLLKKEKQSTDDSNKEQVSGIANCNKVTYTPEDDKIKIQLLNDWKQFNADPFWLYNDSRIKPPELKELKTSAVNKIYVISPK